MYFCNFVTPFLKDFKSKFNFTKGHIKGNLGDLNPFLNKIYVGSSNEFEILLQSLFANTLVNVYGIKGIGKTKFLKEFLRRSLRLNFIDKV